MQRVDVRPMTAGEFEEWQTEIAEAYAVEQVEAGRWGPDGAVERARDENARLLPDGPLTERMLVLRGVDVDGAPIGRAWVGLDHPRGAPGIAFLYDIEVIASRRGRGLGRALLNAVEEAARRAGASALELNVFGRNTAAVGLYESAGYVVVTQQMRKSL
ncbi:GNAT family N-acetyltransferase [Agromyces marinus]|uniref:N-acetyltransferase n=1 Tax=Agromyces marinus TaxID=1389020 RepID=A0ABM8GXC9_9MICO|nr:GNAT family N-acetyltransferase [Agromyces marinus]UIP58577.1 putative N-acetyltransferase YycN [Agromyces marinus]BDZ53143.1 N-acetyltransferase [Agromyces marinus]